MATTDARTGFRLPWSGEQRQTNDGSPDETGAPSDRDTGAAGGDPTAHATASTTESPWGTAAAPGESTSAPSPDRSNSSPPSRPPARRPNKFLADLARAMHAAAEAERAETLERLQAEAKAFSEQIHARSADGATQLRKQADEDVSGIRDWSKAEIARIRDETERRITERKARLEEEIEAHAARIERDIERVQATVDAFEARMAQFFEALLAEEDPTSFAEMAERLPEPPSFDTLDPDWQPAHPIVDGPAAAAETSDTGAPEAVDVGAGPERLVAGESVEAASPGEGTVDPWTGVAWTTTPDAVAEGTSEGGSPEVVADATDAESAQLVETAPVEDQELAFAAIQAAAEAGDDVATDEAESTAETPAETPAGEAPAGTGETATGWAAETFIGAAPNARDVAGDPTGDAATTAETTADDDPRLAAIGSSPDFAAAEAEAFEAVDATAAEEIPTIADDALAARLAGLVPGVATAHSSETATTQVVVVGLISVASIAGFKRQLARVPGVQSVGVSSGPDGEFVFTATHTPELVLADVVPTLSGFQATVTGTGEGVVNVTAHDPESDG